MHGRPHTRRDVPARRYRTAAAAPLTVRTSAGSFVSAYRPGVATHWSLAAPDMPPGNAQPELPVAIFLHGLGGDHSVLLENLAADEALQRHLDAGGAPFAIAAVDGGDNWWHPRANGTDTQSMLVKEFAPFLGRRGYDLGRIGLFGLSMGGFGALLLASQGRLPGVRAVAAMSPAVWKAYDPRLEQRLRRPGRLRGPRRVRAPAPASRHCPNGSIAAPGTTLPPRFVTTAPDCRAPSRAASSPAATTTATGVPSCPTCCPSWAATSA